MFVRRVESATGIQEKKGGWGTFLLLDPFSGWRETKHGGQRSVRTEKKKPLRLKTRNIQSTGAAISASRGPKLAHNPPSLEAHERLTAGQPCRCRSLRLIQRDGLG